MSAYVNEKGGQVFAFNGNSQTISASQSDLPPTLPKFSSELEAFILVARKIETALHQERAQSDKLRNEMMELQQKCAQSLVDFQNKAREYAMREESLKTRFASREETFKSEIQSREQTEKSLHQQIEDQNRQADVLREERRKALSDMEFYKAHLDNYKRRERSLAFTLQNVQASEKTRADQIEKLSQEVQRLKKELSQYQVAWMHVQEMDRKAKQVQAESAVLKRNMEEIGEALTAEKMRREKAEELIKKEKRDKEIALSCLHKAEEKLSHQIVKDSTDDRRIELKF